MMSVFRFFTSRLWGANKEPSQLTGSLPADILRLVFPHLEQPDLARCCLASQAFCSAAREHLVSQVTLANGRDCASFHELLRTHPEVGTFVRSLEIVTEGNSKLPERDWATLYHEKLSFILDSVSGGLFDFAYRVDEAGQNYTQLPPTLKKAINKLFTGSPRLTTVSIHNLSFPIRVFASAPQLTSIHLNGVIPVIDEPAAANNNELSKLDNIRTLVLDRCSNQTLEVLLSLFSFPVLREITLRRSTYNGSLVKQILNQTRGSLQKLEWGPISEQSDLPDIGEMTWLESLNLGPPTNVTNNEGAWRWLMSSLATGPKAHGLEELTLEGFRSTSDYSTWLVDDPLYALLNEALLQPKFGQLKQVTLKVPVAQLEWMEYGRNPANIVFSKMLRLLEAGKVRVVMGGKMFPELKRE